MNDGLHAPTAVTKLSTLPSTGERFIPGLGGMIELEHRHRYLFARQVCAGKVVLDIACGEGYGSSMLAQAARSVIGVDIAEEAIAHARKHYSAANLGFKVGDCAAIPVADASVDVVVSFETIEHHDQHEEMMGEIRRVLRPGGLLILSSPERFEYSERPGTKNDFHVHELYRDEFVDLVGRYFSHLDIYDQKVIFGSTILAEQQATHAVSGHADSLHEVSRGLVRPLFLIAVASDTAIPPLDTGVFEQELKDSSEWKWWMQTVQERDVRIRQLDAQVEGMQRSIEDRSGGSTKAAEAESAREALSLQLLEAERQRTRTEQQRHELIAQVLDLEGRVAGLQDELVQRQGALDREIALRSSEAQQRLEAREKELDRQFAGRREELQKTFETHAAELEMARRDSEDALKAEAARREGHLQAEFAVQRKALRATWQEREEKLVAEIQNRKVVFESRLRSERDELATLRQRLADVENERVRKSGQHSDVVALLASSEAERVAVVEQLAVLREAVSEAESVAEDLRDELIPLHHYAAKLQWVLSVTEHTLEKTRTQAVASQELLEAQAQLRDALYRSTSWRITAPLRYAKKVMQKTARLPRVGSRAFVRVLRMAYRRTPADASVKVPAKDAFFRVFGFALRGTAMHDDWLRFGAARSAASSGQPSASSVSPARASAAASAAEPSNPFAEVALSEQMERQQHRLEAARGEIESIPQLVEEVTVMTEPETRAPTYSAAGAPLWVADGTREWLDLETMREGIASFEAARLQAIVPAPVAMVSLAGQDPATAAESLVFASHAKPTVTILIPVYNKIGMTLECLTSIAKARCEVAFEVLVADDASTDATATVLDRIPNIKVRRNANNLHFLRNCNASLPMVEGEYVVFLNNDVQVQDWWLDEMLSTFGTQPRAGAVGPKILYPSGHLQEAGVAFNADMTVDMVGLNDDPQLPRFNYVRRVDYCSGACLMVPTQLLKALDGFSEEFAPAYCEDGDLCLRIRQRGLFVYYVPQATVVHRLSATTAAENLDVKRRMVAKNLVTFAEKWQGVVERQADVRAIAFYLPQYYPFPENDRWWGKGFTEWTNVTKAQPNFVGHYQPHLPADLGYYDLRLAQAMEDQAALARRYGLGGFCFYYYWFAGKRLLDLPVERLLDSGKPSYPFCLCWANENWTRRWDGQETHVLMAQSHTDSDDEAVIKDLIRFFRSPDYIRIDDRPLVVVYRVTLFPDFAKTAARWRHTCRAEGIGEIYIAMVESFELVATETHPSRYGCDATIEFPPQGLAEAIPTSGALVNPDFTGTSVDYRTLAMRYANRPLPAYTRFRGAMPGWDNTPRRQNNSYCIEHATPGGFQAWLEHIVDDTRKQHFGDERIVFINAWNEWAEGAHLEPDRRFGHTHLEALRNAKDRRSLLRMHRYVL